jgi:hypothetical protein
MKFPPWTSFVKGLSNFENHLYEEKNKLTEKIKELKGDHPVIDEIINLSFLQLLKGDYNLVYLPLSSL